ncbi:MAG: DoxX family protein [Rhodospirillales bacterium]|jgi:putative oxidoreductase|nr:DoxX family protein [Rhodospirillales bacterium]
MYADHTTLQIAGQLLISVLFLGTAIINSTTKVKQHVDRMAAMNIPAPALVLWVGFAMQYVGGFMVALDYKTDIGAMILIVFTLLATALFHRWWTVDDPLRRHFHLSFVFSNCAVLGGLLFLI